MKKILQFILILCVISYHYLLIPSFGEVNPKHTEIETYLNSIITLEANLIQISSNGQEQTGKILIKKPGMMRFEYDPPADNLVMASGSLLVVIDRNSTSEPQRYLTSQTPIGYILEETINLDENSDLKAISFQGPSIHLSLYNNNKPNAGELELVFSQDPIILKEWTITNYSGEKTRILLEQVIINKAINKELFNIGREISNFKKRTAKN